jgi:DNA-directed RNA polymerase specialized sigma24 family protein
MAHDDTDIGCGRGRFPTTHISAVLGVRSAEPEVRARSFGALVAAYWKPVYKHVRGRWKKSNEDAKDLTQAFFLRAMEKDFFDAYDREKGRFRTFLRTCLDHFLSNENKSEGRLKRGGGEPPLSLDFEGAEAELQASPPASRSRRCAPIARRAARRSTSACSSATISTTAGATGRPTRPWPRSSGSHRRT